MKNILKINHSQGAIIMDRTFAKFAENTRSDEYKHLQQVRRDYPFYLVKIRKIKTNSNKKTYKGLTYKYMEDYIATHTAPANKSEALAEFHELLLISRCHSSAYRYPTIKKWFLQKYSEIAKFGAAELPTISNEKETLLKKAA
uniref:Uncharacterized protein n=1 Tax=uncultured Bacillota bacterium TaxID=344338 RepID=A0A650ENG6_9FIRM|nr:hypothetical protein Firmicute1046_0480 [uncultured Firmicutes bacterium]